MLDPQVLRHERAALLSDGALVGVQWSHAYHQWVLTALEPALKNQSGVALTILGSGARGGLCPGSDLDLWLVHRGGKGSAGAMQRTAEALWYPLWDAGLHLGHAVRSIKEALKLAADDLDTATALLDVEFVSGDRDVVDELARLGRTQFVRHGGKWASELVDATAQRHERAGDVPFLLEPDLKEGAGGLRDVATLGWLHDCGVIAASRDAGLDDARAVLLGARVELHRHVIRSGSGKATDRLSLQDQDAVAAALSYSDADVLMRAVSSAARRVSWLLDEAIRATAPAQRAQGRRYAGDGLVAVDGELCCDGAGEALDDLAADPTLACRAAEAAARGGLALAPSLLEMLAHRWAGPGDPWRAEAQRAFVRLLALGQTALPTWEALDQSGVLARLIPEWIKVGSRPQRNAYHRFTVDRHLVETAFEAARLTGRVSRPDLLLVGALLHDIGKGYTARRGEPGETDHTQAGMPVARAIAARMGFSAADSEAIVEMMRHHLLLPDVATRRDLDDPATVHAVAVAVGSIEALELLDALTEADSLATGPAAWSPWKSRLVSELVARTKAELTTESGTRRRFDATFPDEAARVVLAEARAHDRLVVHGAGDVVRIAGRDRPGLLASIAGVCAVHGVAILRARVSTSDDGWALDELVIDEAGGRKPDWRRVEADIVAASNGEFDTAARLAQRERDYAPLAASRASAVGAQAGGRVGAASALVPVEPSVEFAADAESQRATIAEVRAPDRLGLLSTVAGALAGVGCNIVSATVASIAGGVVDTFYLQTPAGEKLTSEQRDAASTAVMSALA